MEGIYRGINGNLVQIDSKFYKFEKPQFAPKQKDVMVSFSTSKDDPTICTYIKVKEAQAAAPAAEVKPTDNPAPASTAPAATESKPTYQKKSYGSGGGYKSTSFAPKAGGYGSPEDVKGKEVGCAIGAAAAILAGRTGTAEEILKDMEKLVGGILAMSKYYKALP